MEIKMAKKQYNDVHKQVPAKIKAYVDEEIKELIELFNDFNGIVTASSCQGTSGKCRAHVYINYEVDDLDQCLLYENKRHHVYHHINRITEMSKLAEFAQRLYFAIHKYVFVDNYKSMQDDYPGLLSETKFAIEWTADSLNSEEWHLPGTLILEFPHARLKQITEIVRNMHREIQKEVVK